MDGILRFTILSNFSGFTSLGCWSDSLGVRAIPQLDGADPSISDSYRTRSDAIEKCFRVARERGLVLFALQDGGWCVGADNLNGYKKYGSSDKCKNGKGGDLANDVYRITNPGIQIRSAFIMHNYVYSKISRFRYSLHSFVAIESHYCLLSPFPLNER